MRTSISLECDRPAASNKAVVFACDEKYARYALMAAQQIALMHPARDFDICLCSNEAFTVPPGLAHHGFRVCQIQTGRLFDGLRLDEGRTDVVYLRLALPEVFAGQYERLLYLDGDVFIQSGDFAALLDLDLGSRTLGAVRDNMQWRTPGRRPEQFRRLGLPAFPYFNAGVLLIDVERFNHEGILGQCIDFGRANRARMIRHDQNLLNGVLRGNWAELNPVWNWQYTWASRMTEAMIGANIVHFIGPRKPWKHEAGEFPLRFKRAYRDFFAAHFPESPIGPDGVPPHGNRAFLRKMLAKHLLAAGKMANYLNRFENDYTVLGR